MKPYKLLTFFTYDIKNKLIALFFAIIVWYFAWNSQIRVSDRERVLVNIKIDKASMSEDQWQIVKIWTARPGDPDIPFNNYVKLSLSGPQRDIHEVNWEQIKGSIVVNPYQCQENAGYRLGQEQLSAKTFRLPNSSLKVVEGSITPNVIHYRLSRVLTKSLRVLVKPDNIVGHPAPPYRLSTKRLWEVEPERLFIRGPEAYFGSCEIVAGKIDLEDIEPKKLSYKVKVPVSLNSTVKDKYSIRLVNENGVVLTESSVKVTVTLFFEKEPTKQLEPIRVPVWAKTPFSGTSENMFALSWEPSALWVTFVGIQEDLDLLKKNKSKPGFGLYFVVQPSTQIGVSNSISLPDLKWDYDYIPRRITIEPVKEVGKETEVIEYNLQEIKRKK